MGIRSQSCFCPPLVSHWQPRELLVKWRRSLPVSAQDTQTLTTWYMVEDIVKNGIKGLLKTILPFHKSEFLSAVVSLHRFEIISLVWSYTVEHVCVSFRIIECRASVSQ